MSYLTGCGGADGPGEGGGARRRAQESGGGAGGRARGALRPARLAVGRRRVSRGPGRGLGLKDGGAGGEAHQSCGGGGGAQPPRPAWMARRRGAGVAGGSSGGLAPAEVSHAAENKSCVPGEVTESLGESQAMCHCPR